MTVPSAPTKNTTAASTIAKTRHTNASSSSSSLSFSWFHISLTLLACGISFYGGTLWTLHNRMKQCMDTTTIQQEKQLQQQEQLHPSNKEEWSVSRHLNMSRSNMQQTKKSPFIKISQQQQQQQQQQVQQQQQESKQGKETKAEETTTNNNNNKNNNEPILPKSIRRYVTSMVRMKRTNFMEYFHFGLPDNNQLENSTDIIMFYSRDDAMPKNRKLVSKMAPLSYIENIEEGVENCDFLHVIFTHHDAGSFNPWKQCLAIVPQYESFHLYRYGRFPVQPIGPGKPAPLNKSSELRLISRGKKDTGIDEYGVPKKHHVLDHFEILKNYLSAYKNACRNLQPILKKIAIRNTVIVLVCNFGQSELLMNFVCSARSRKLDTSAVIVFCTDTDTVELAKGLGLATFYDEALFGKMPHNEAQVYGDDDFVAMMFGKVICVQLVNILGFNLLFQDVDIIWYKHPLTYFHKELSYYDDFDIFFQNDGQYSVRYAPYSANSGFYYVKFNQETQYLLTTMITQMGAQLFKSNSHQEVLITRLSEFVSLFGLRIKIFDREPHCKFPAGFHFHRQDGDYFREFFDGKQDPILYHMSWTTNKKDKILFLKQLGEWYIRDDALCIQQTANQIQQNTTTGNSNGFNLFGGSNQAFVAESCCAAEPTVTCHFRDKPSKIPCHHSPPHVKNKKSWWK